MYRIVRLLVLICFAGWLAGCSSLTGYPASPTPTQSDLSALAASFDPGKVARYFADTDPVQRQQLRNDIVWGRMSAYDARYQEFKQRLNSEANGTSVSTDLAVLILGGLTSTTGGAATKAALGAASAGVVGAKGAISKDLFYEKTLPGLFSQMDAGRAKIRAKIIAGLMQNDANYPLPLGLSDLGDYYDAGSIPGAISGVVEQASIAKAQADYDIDALRTVSYANVASTQQLIAWLYPGGSKFDTQGKPIKPNLDKVKELTQWMSGHGLGDFAWYQLLGDRPELEEARQAAIAALIK